MLTLFHSHALPNRREYRQGKKRTEKEIKCVQSVFVFSEEMRDEREARCFINDSVVVAWSYYLFLSNIDFILLTLHFCCTLCVCV